MVAHAPPYIYQDIEIYVVWLDLSEDQQIGFEQPESYRSLSPFLNQRICNHAVPAVLDTKDGGSEWDTDMISQ